MQRKTIGRTLTSIGVIFLILISGYFILNAIIKKKIGDQFENISPFLLVKYSKVHANILSSSVLFDSLSIDFVPYAGMKQNKHHLNFSRVSLKGISFLKFIINKKLVATDLLLDSGNILLDSFLLEKKDSAQSTVFSEIKWPYKKLYIRNVELKNVQVSRHAEGDDQRLVTADAQLEDVSIDKPGATPSFNDITARLSGLNYIVSGYKIRLANMSLSSRRAELKLDSLHIASTKNQSELAVPSVQITGFDLMKLLNKKILAAKHVDVDE